MIENQITLWGAFMAGGVSFASPCVLPLFPSYLGYVSGVSLEQLQNKAESRNLRRKVLPHALCFILGFSLIFMALGATASVVGRLLVRYQSILSRVSGVLVIVMGLLVLEVIRPRLLIREWRLLPGPKHLPGYPVSLLVGMGFGAGWTPCIGPLLGTMLMMAANTQTVGAGIALLSAYSLGLAVPFVLGAIGLGWALDAVKWLRRYLHGIRKSAGMILLIVGLLLVTGYYEVLTQYLVGWIGGR